MTVLTLPALLISALVVFAGIYLREAVRQAQQQKIVAARVIANYQLTCNSIASSVYNASHMQLIKLITDDAETILRAMNNNLLQSKESTQELSLISVAIRNLALKIESQLDLNEPPLDDFISLFNQHYADMKDDECIEEIDSYKRALNRATSDPTILTDKDGAVISARMASSIAQIRSLSIEINEELISILSKAHFRGNKPEFYDTTARSMITLLFKISLIIEQVARLWSEANSVLSKSNFHLTIEKIFY